VRRRAARAGARTPGNDPSTKQSSLARRQRQRRAHRGGALPVTADLQGTQRVKRCVVRKSGVSGGGRRGARRLCAQDRWEADERVGVVSGSGRWRQRRHQQRYGRRSGSRAEREYAGRMMMSAARDARSRAVMVCVVVGMPHECARGSRVGSRTKTQIRPACPGERHEACRDQGPQQQCRQHQPGKLMPPAPQACEGSGHGFESTVRRAF
jgi:hypothetical protein